MDKYVVASQLCLPENYEVSIDSFTEQIYFLLQMHGGNYLMFSVLILLQEIAA